MPSTQDLTSCAVNTRTTAILDSTAFVTGQGLPKERPLRLGTAVRICHLLVPDDLAHYICEDMSIEKVVWIGTSKGVHRSRRDKDHVVASSP